MERNFLAMLGILCVYQYHKEIKNIDVADKYLSSYTTNAWM